MTDDPRRCTAKANRTGERCARKAMIGLTVCATHGGRAKRAKEKSARAKAALKVSEQLETLGVPVAVDPGVALLELIGQKYAEVHWLRGRVQGVDPASLVWGVVKREEGEGAFGPTSSRVESSAANAWWQLLRSAEDQLAKYCQMALSAGVEERRIRLAEEQGTLLASVIHRILGGLNLSVEQQSLVGVVVPRELRALSRG